MGASGTRARIIEQNAYNPKRNWGRVQKSMHETQKKPGDVVFGEQGKVFDVNRDGTYTERKPK